MKKHTVVVGATTLKKEERYDICRWPVIRSVLGRHGVVDDIRISDTSGWYYQHPKPDTATRGRFIELDEW